jgi:hypothetical protein
MKHFFFYQGSTAHSEPRPPHYRGFMITHRQTTLDRTPLDEWSARPRDLYLTTHNTHDRQISTPSDGLEPAIPASKQPQNHALDSAATGIGIWNITYININLSSQWRLQTANCHLSLSITCLFHSFLCQFLMHLTLGFLIFYLIHTNPLSVILCTCPFLVGFQETLKPSVPAFLVCFIWCDVPLSLLSMNSTVNWSENSDRPLYYQFLHFKRDYAISSNSRQSALALTTDKLNSWHRLLTLQPNYFRSVFGQKKKLQAITRLLKQTK